MSTREITTEEVLAAYAALCRLAEERQPLTIMGVRKALEAAAVALEQRKEYTR